MLQRTVVTKKKPVVAPRMITYFSRCGAGGVGCCVVVLVVVDVKGSLGLGVSLG